MSNFTPTPISIEDQDDLRADARAEMFFALRKSFGQRSKDCGLKAKDLSEILDKNKSYVSRVLNGSNGSIDFETLYVFMHALGYHLPLNPVSFEELHTNRSNWDARPSYDNTTPTHKQNLYGLRYKISKADDSSSNKMSTKRPRATEVHKVESGRP